MDQNYSFCKFKIPQNGGRVIWEITNECNYGCKYCIFSSTGKKPLGELNTQQVFDVIDQLKLAGFTYIKITGGEPFLRNDMINILSYARHLGFDLDISTNASKITPEIAQALANLNLEYIHVSIDGYNQETHEVVRGKKSFLPTINGLRLLKKYNNKVRIGTVIHLHNQHHIQEMTTFFNSFNVEQIAYSLMEPVGRLQEKSELLYTESKNKIVDFIRHLSSTCVVSQNIISEQSVSINFPLKDNQPNISCPGGEKFLFINSIGIVSPCPWISEYAISYHQESLHNSSLSSILKSKTFIEFKWVKNNYTKISYGCPIDNLKDFKNSQKAILEQLDFFLNEQSSLSTETAFNSYSPIYSFSTENLSYLSQLDIKNKNVLTVTGSGDHTIVLSLLGAKSITNIDVNHYAKYYSELKIAALLSFSYEEFQTFFLNSDKAFSYSSYLSIKDKLPLDTSYFWDYVYSFFQYDGNRIRHSKLLNLKYDINESKIKNSYYLMNEEYYLQAKKSLLNVSITFLTQDIQNRTTLSSDYDIILLSNIADYSHKMFPSSSLNGHIYYYKEKIVMPYLKHIHEDGLIMFAYVFDALNILKSNQRNQFNTPAVRYSYYNDDNINYSEINVDSAIPSAQQDSICILKRKHYESNQ